MVGLEDLHYDYLERIFSYLPPVDVYNLSRQCQFLRNSVIRFVGDEDKRKVSVPWEYIKIDVGRPITVLRKKRVGMKRNRAEWKKDAEFATTESDLLHASRFFRLACEFIHLRARCFSPVIVDALNFLVKNCTDGPNQTLLFEADKITLEADELRQFLESCNPLSLHFYGRFDRSIITKEVIPSSVMNLFVGEEDLMEKGRSSNLDSDFFMDLVERWRDSTGLRIPPPSYRLPFMPVSTSENGRQLDVDYCNLTVQEIYRLFESMLTVTNISQTIRFYNVTADFISVLCRSLQPMTTMATRTIERFIESRQIDADDREITKKIDLHLSTNTTASLDKRKRATPTNIVRLTTKVLHGDEEIISVELSFYGGPQGVKAVYPEIVADWTRVG